LFAHAVADAPAHDFSGVHVNIGCHVHEALGHWYVSDIGTPFP